MALKAKSGAGGTREQRRLIAYLGEAGRKKPPLAELMQFYRELLTICAENPPAFLGETKLWRDEISVAPASAAPPLQKIHELDLDQEAAEKLFGRLCRWLAGRPRTQVEAQKIEAARRQRKFSTAELFLHALGREEDFFPPLAQALNLKGTWLYFLAYNSVRPAVEALAAELRRHWEPKRGSLCPGCGSFPAMAQLREEAGRRFFYCSFCLDEWEGRRLVCPYCQNQEQDTLRYFTVEGEEDCPVYVCELCKKYIKTLNSREGLTLGDSATGAGAGMPWFMKDLVTPHLDILAAQQGYQRGAHNIFALQIT